MLICIVCGKVIADVDPTTVRYGGCAACPIDEVSKLMNGRKKHKDAVEVEIARTEEQKRRQDEVP